MRRKGLDRATRAYVFDRDKQCILAWLDRSHVCFDRWGEKHEPGDLDRLTIEHVRKEPGGSRSDDAGRLVTMCHRSNELHSGSTTETRALLNAYLLGCANQEVM